MKRYILGIVAVVLGVTMGGGAEAQSDDASQHQRSDEQFSRMEHLVTVIDDVEIPDYILIDIQLEHIGHAVTAAKKIPNSDGDAYRLRVNRYDNPDEYQGFYLIYDSEWELIDEKDIVPPPTPEPAEEKPVSDDDEQDVEEDNNDEKPEPRESNRNDSAQPEEEAEDEKPREDKPENEKPEDNNDDASDGNNNDN